ncbi:FAD-dependent oxidoreductase [Xaviernesmea oryzae]|nr:FAD-dependent oxidoreductase [Xaviernesmea oryzae]SEL59986.1 FAD dependent oxidoreductase [Xaviernesmea oryzae]
MLARRTGAIATFVLAMVMAFSSVSCTFVQAQELANPVLETEGDAARRSASRGTCKSADVIVYGATPSGIAAAIQAARLKKTVILLEPTQHIGGMMAGGLSRTDAAPHRGVYGGIVTEFFDKATTTYQLTDPIRIYFEAKWAEQTFGTMLNASKVTVIRGQLISSVKLKNRAIQSLTTTSGRSFCGTSFIDASYEGDLMQRSGAKTIVGRESQAQYGEEDAGVVKLRLPPVGSRTNPTELVLDPYIVPGDPQSGLLPGLSPIGQQPIGSADKSVMAFNYRLCVTNTPGNKRPFTKPADYDPMRYEAHARFIAALNAQGQPISENYFVGADLTVKNKLDVNSNAYFSTDVWNIGYDYAVGNEAKRQEIRKSVRSFIQGLMWFAVSDPRVPQATRDYTAQYGYCADEYTDNDNFPYQLYVRQARRLVGQYVLTENDLKNKPNFLDSIGVGYAPLDQHGMIRTVQDGHIAEDNRYPFSVAPYQIPYRALLPNRSDVTNLLVSVAVSASHVAYTSIRMEPTYMVMGQAAGAAAALAPDGDVSKVSIAKLRSTLLKAGQVLKWDKSIRLKS